MTTDEKLEACVSAELEKNYGGDAWHYRTSAIATIGRALNAGKALDEICKEYSVLTTKERKIVPAGKDVKL